MPCSPRTLLAKGVLLLAVALLGATPALGQGAKKPPISKDVTFNTADDVKLSGTLYPNPGGKKDAVVMLLHNFDLKKGGGSSQPGWAELAEILHKEGYTVFSFDFRGFGESKTVGNNFWNTVMFPHNSALNIKGALKKGNTLDHKNFSLAYVKFLVNDIAAAKAYLDRRNDAKELNSSNLVLIGAGEGAALGSMWLANEARRRRDTNVPPLQFGPPALTSASELEDVACAVWLSISPKVLGFGTPVERWVVEVGKKNKKPMAFVYGKNDSNGSTLAKNLVAKIKTANGGKGAKEKSLSGSFAVPGTKLAGNLLLDKDLDKLLPSKDDKGFLLNYLEQVFNDRGTKEQKDRKSEASAYWYVTTTPSGQPRAVKISKKAGQEAPEVNFGFLP
jgi:pimeloyl-ACP methyl ester carboxylesterase